MRRMAFISGSISNCFFFIEPAKMENVCICVQCKKDLVSNYCMLQLTDMNQKKHFTKFLLVKNNVVKLQICVKRICPINFD